MKVAFVRGKFINNFESQNYRFDRKKIEVTGFSSLFPIHSRLPFPLVRLPSLADFNSRAVKYIANRTIGDMHNLVGIEKYASQFDLFHTADSYYYYSYQLARLRKQNKIKAFVSTSWETIPFNNESTMSKKRIKYETMKTIDHHITYSKKAKGVLVLEGVPEKKIKIVRLGVDRSKFHPAKKSLTHKKLSILFVGRLVDEKGIVDFIEVLSKIDPKKVDVNIIGGGPLRWLAEQKGIEVQQKKYEEMPEEYRKADIFVFPSKKTKTWEEQYGMALVEAMASGCSIVAYNTGAIPEILKDAGLLIRPEKKDLARSLTELIEREDLRLNLSEKAKRQSSYFDSQVTAKEIGTIYYDLIKHNSSHLK